MDAASVHAPILTDELLELLQLTPGARCIDATIDGGGHTAALLSRIGASGRVLGLDRDPTLLGAARQRFGTEIADDRVHLVHASFADLANVATEHGFNPADAIIFDLGVSSYHFDLSGRGFTFTRDEPLDMRFDPDDTHRPTAAALLNGLDAEDIADIIYRFGEERMSRRIARCIVDDRPLHSSNDLFESIKRALPARIRWQAGKSAARVFQALRIAVNQELEAVASALPQALALLAPGGRLAVLSFHSLEDRMVKQLFVAEKHAGRVQILTKKPVRAAAAEVATNSRAASAKLRVCARL